MSHVVIVSVAALVSIALILWSARSTDVSPSVRERLRRDAAFARKHRVVIR